MRSTEDFWVSEAQVAHLEQLVDEVGPEASARVLKSFAGGSRLEDVARYLTRREAASLILLLTVVGQRSAAATPIVHGLYRPFVPSKKVSLN